MTIEELGQKTKAKYPQYSNISDLELGTKVLQKYPQYNRVINQNILAEPPAPPAQTVQPQQKNIIPAIGEAAGQATKSFITEAIPNALIGGAKGALSTIQGISTLGQGVINKVTGLNQAPVTISPKYTEASNSLQAGGKAGEQLAEFFIPASTSSKLIRTGEAATKAAGLTGKVAQGANLLTRSLVGAGEMAGVTALQTGGNKEAIKESAKYGFLLPILSSATATGYNAVKNAKVASNAKKLTALTQSVAQGELKDISKEIKAISSIDVKGVKTYQDLSSRFEDKISNLATTLDTAFEGVKTVKTLPTLTRTIKVGNQKIAHNYVNDALNQLDDFYTKTGNLEKKALVEQVRNKANTVGLSVADINNIARQHGTDLNAFNVNGELASGLKKQMAESTRKGVKETAREIFNNPIYEKIDAEITSLMRAKELAKDMAEKVNQLQGKMQGRGILEKISGTIADTLDMATGRIASGAARKILVPRGGGIKTANPVDLERALQKSLKQIQSLSKKQLIRTIPPVERGVIGQTLLGSKKPITQTEVQYVQKLGQDIKKLPIGLSIEDVSKGKTKILKGNTLSETSSTALNQIKSNPKISNYYNFTKEELSKMTVQELKIIRKSTASFEVLGNVEDILKNKGKIAQRSDQFLQNLNSKTSTTGTSKLSGNEAIKSQLSENALIKELKTAGVKIDNNIATVYRGGNVSKEQLRNLRYNDYLSSVKTGKDITGNSGASEYGKNVVEFKIPIKDLKVENGEIKYIGKSNSLIGKKYPEKIYRAFNDVYGSNYTAKEIDAMKISEIKDVASQGLTGGREEFDKLIKSQLSENALIQEAKKYKTAEVKKKR